MKLNKTIYPILTGLFLASGLAKADLNLCPLTFTGTVNVQTRVTDPNPNDNLEISGSNVTVQKYTNKDVLEQMKDDNLISSITGYALYALVDTDSGSIEIYAIRNAKNPNASDYDSVSASNYIELTSRTEIAYSEAEKYNRKFSGDTTTSLVATGSFSSAIKGAHIFAYGDSNANEHVGNIKGSWAATKYTYTRGNSTYVQYMQQIKSAVITLMGGVPPEDSSYTDNSYTEITLKLGTGVLTLK
jgi:hypothetical protein